MAYAAKKKKTLWSEIFASYYYLYYTVLRHSFTMDLLSRCALEVRPKRGLVDSYVQGASQLCPNYSLGRS